MLERKFQTLLMRRQLNKYYSPPELQTQLTLSPVLGGSLQLILFIYIFNRPQNLKKDDVILLPLSEHNSNLLPWWVLCDRVGCSIEYVKVI